MIPLKILREGSSHPLTRFEHTLSNMVAFALLTSETFLISDAKIVNQKNNGRTKNSFSFGDWSREQTLVIDCWRSMRLVHPIYGYLDASVVCNNLAFWVLLIAQEFTLE